MKLRRTLHILKNTTIDTLKPLLIGILSLFVNKKQVIIMVDGGLGSQILKYALGLNYIVKGFTVKYDITWFKHNGKDIAQKENRNFDFINVFSHINFPLAKKYEIFYYKSSCYHWNKYPYTYVENIYPPPVYLDGYYDHYKYLYNVLPQIKTNLHFSNLQLNITNLEYCKQIQREENSVAIHIRQGDYLGTIHEVLSKNYYVNAIYAMLKREKNCHFFFFSNDLAYIKNTLLPVLNKKIIYTIVAGNSNDLGYYDLYLISQCKHQIVSNSSFGYLGAILNNNNKKTVIIPDRWINRDTDWTLGSEKAHIIPDSIVIKAE